MSGIAQKVKDTMSSDKSNTQDIHNHGAYDTTAPRTAGAPGHTVGGTTTGTNYTTGSTGTSGLSHSAGGPAPGTDGPHKSDMMNKMDPRIDSDRDHSKNMGLNSAGTAATGSHAHSQTANRDEPLIGSGLGGHSTTHGSSMTGTHGHTGPSGGTLGNTHHTTTTGGIGSTGHTTGNGEGDFGPHSGRAANALDPRVDSDRDGSSRVGGNTHSTGTTGGLGSTGGIGGTHHTGTTGGVGSTHHTGTTGGIGSSHHTTGTTHTTGGLGSSTHTTGGHSTTHGTSGIGGTTVTGPGSKTTGPAPNTAGPHKSDMLNKLDPRVDSNLDGSKTVGGDKTHAADKRI